MRRKKYIFSQIFRQPCTLRLDRTCKNFKYFFVFEIPIKICERNNWKICQNMYSMSGIICTMFSSFWFLTRSSSLKKKLENIYFYHRFYHVLNRSWSETLCIIKFWKTETDMIRCSKVIYLSIYIYTLLVCLSVGLSVCLSVCLSVYLLVYQKIIS